MADVSVMWFRRDLRLADNPALLAACEAGGVVALFVLDDSLRDRAGAPRLAFLYRCLRSLDNDLDGNLVVRKGKPADVIARVVEEVGAISVYCAEDFGPYGRERDDQVAARLADLGCELVSVDSPYAIEPGAIVKSNGDPYQVFTPFFRAWDAHGWATPRAKPRKPRWVKLPTEAIPEDPPHLDAVLPPAGEREAQKCLRRFLDGPVRDYTNNRDFPAVDGTSGLSPYLKFGCIHPRQILAALKDAGAGPNAKTFRSELCWREFFADVLFHQPQAKDHAVQRYMASMQLDTGKTADERFEAWTQGQTGYPIVDAGMRQLLGEAFMHNRVRMIVASFLVKDLHIDWTRGADWFMEHLVDGDIASNSLNWQWVAGTGTDAAPYFRIFNPVTQSKKFDPTGEYIRRWVPELRHLDDRFIHEPWKAPRDLFASGTRSDIGSYPDPIVDHDTERKEALRRYRALRD